MDESILTSVKKLLGIPEEYDHFDQDLIIHINSVFSVLNQLGVGDEEGFAISDSSATWKDFLPNEKELNMAKSYMYMKVRMLFDPPTNGSVADAMNKSISEFEWRLEVAADPVEE